MAVTGVLAFVMGTFYLVRQLNSPFDINYEGPQFVTSSEQDAAERELQRTTDTDSDGLVDYDELYIYGTSMYLSDSDGDNYSDSAELAAGTDPLCQPGKTCLNSIYGSYVEDSANSLVNYAEDSTNDSLDSITDLQSALSQLSAAEVRQLLLDSGADEATVNQLTDEELIAVYQQVLSDLEESGELESMLEASTDATTVTP